MAPMPMVPMAYSYMPTGMRMRDASQGAMSRGPSPGPAIHVPVYTAAVLSSPPLSHRGISGREAATARMHGAFPVRLTSRSPPPQRPRGEMPRVQVWAQPSPDAERFTPRYPPEPVAVPAVRVASQSLQAHVSQNNTMSTQSLPNLTTSVHGGMSGPLVIPTIAVQAMHPIVCPTPQPPSWAYVQPTARDHPLPHHVCEALEQQRIEQVVRNEVQKQLHGAGDLESTRQRMMVQESVLHRDLDIKLQEAHQRLQMEVEEHERTKRQLERCQDEHQISLVSQQRLEVEQRTHRDQSEGCAEELRQRCREFERDNQDLSDRMRILDSHKTSSENQAADRERELHARVASSGEKLKSLEGEKRLLQAELDRLREAETETRDLRCHSAMLEDQLRGEQEQHRAAQEHLQRAAEKLENADEELRQWYQRHLETDKEIRAWKRRDQEKLQHLTAMEYQLLQERNVNSMLSPSEFKKMARALEPDSLLAENGELKYQLRTTQSQLDLCVRKLDEQERTIKELQREFRGR